MTLRRFTLLFLLLLVLSGAFSSTAWASKVAGFDLIRDAENPDSAFRFDLKPGETIEDRVIIHSTTDTVQRLRVYSADGMPAMTGKIVFKEHGDEMTGLAKWIKIDSKELIELEPGESRSVWFRLTIPENSGTQEEVAGIVVERAEAGKNDTDEQASVNTRPHAALLVTQRPPGPANLILDIINFGRANGLWSRPVLFSLTLRNAGNVLVLPTGKVDLYNLFGRKSDSIKLRRLSTIFAGRTTESRFQWENTPPLGYFTAKVSIEYDKDRTVTRWAPIMILPWWLIFIIFPLLLIARQARRRWAAKQADGKDKTAREAMEALARTVDKIKATAPEAVPTAAAPVVTATEEKPKPKRGRPPKKKAEADTAAKTAGIDPDEKPKPKRRGRPPKKKPEETTED